MCAKQIYAIRHAYIWCAFKTWAVLLVGQRHQNKHKSSAQLLLRWPRNVTQVTFSLSSGSTLVISYNIIINRMLSTNRSLGYIVADGIGQPLWRNYPKVRNSTKWHKMTTITPFKVIRGHQYRYQSDARVRLLCVNNCDLYPIMHRFRARGLLSNLRSWQGVPVFNALVRGRTAELRSEKNCLSKLETLLYRTVWIVFRYL